MRRLTATTRATITSAGATPATVLTSLTEAQWQAQVLDLAALLGWDRRLAYHTHDSRRSQPGFPDLVLVRAPRVILAELKRDDGDLTAEQVRWLDALRRCAGGAGGVEVYLWRPRDLETVAAVLRGSVDAPPRPDMPLPRWCAWCSPVGPARWATSTICTRHQNQVRAQIARQRSSRTISRTAERISRTAEYERA